MTQRVTTIGFHDVVEDLRDARPIAPGHGVLYTIDHRQFREHLLAIRSRLGPDAAGLLLTVDDGAISSYEIIAPALDELGWKGQFFITTDWIGRPGFMNAAQIRDLQARGHVIGSHSRSHPERMSQLSDAEMLDEWTESCDRLARILGEPERTASTPGGFYSKRVALAAARAGIETLFTSAPTSSVSMVDGCRILGRYAIRRSTSAPEAAAIAAGDLAPRIKEKVRWLAAAAAKRITGKSYLAIRRMLLTRIVGA